MVVQVAPTRRMPQSVPLGFTKASLILTLSSGTFPVLAATALYVRVSPRFTLPSVSVSPCIGGAIVRVNSVDGVSSSVTVTGRSAAARPS